jgi:hypothetical protein
MVSQMTQDRSVSPFAGDRERELSREARLMSFQPIDTAIAQLAKSLRILLNLDLPSNRGVERKWGCRPSVHRMRKSRRATKTWIRHPISICQRAV